MKKGPTETEQREQEVTKKQLNDLGISEEHQQDVATINKYLEDHRINQLFNVSFCLLTHILITLCRNL